MSDVEDMMKIADISRSRPRAVPLACPCGGQVGLDGWAAPEVTVRYLCAGCGAVRDSLKELVPEENRT